MTETSPSKRYRRRLWPLAAATSLVSGIALVVLLVLVPGRAADDEGFADRAVEVRATVIERNVFPASAQVGGGSSYNVVAYSFQGTDYEVKRHSWKLPVGDTLTISVDPLDAERFEATPTSGNYAVFFAVGAMMLGALSVASAAWAVGSKLPVEDGVGVVFSRSPSALFWPIGAAVIGSIAGAAIATALSSYSRAAVAWTLAGAVIGAFACWLTRPVSLTITPNIITMRRRSGQSKDLALGPDTTWSELIPARRPDMPNHITITDGTQSLRITPENWGALSEMTTATIREHLTAAGAVRTNVGVST